VMPAKDPAPNNDTPYTRVLAFLSPQFIHDKTPAP
jgi:hypothetical protein